MNTGNRLGLAVARTVTLILALLAAPAAGSAATHSQTPERLRIAIVQMAIAPTLHENCDRIVSSIASAKSMTARVVVFPESALSGAGGESSSEVEKAVAAIRQAAMNESIYVLFGAKTYSTALKKNLNWMRLFGPDGADVFYSEKLYDNHRATMPGVFEIDGIPCSAMICADRWLRGVSELPIQQGALISFELSDNFACEWVTPFEWYWYVPRALRNNVWVVLANTGNAIHEGADHSAPNNGLGHGHSAVIAPDGRIAAALPDDAVGILLAEVDLREASRREAIARAAHSVLRQFWETGLRAQKGESIDAPPVVPFRIPETEITLAVAQVPRDQSLMDRMVREARGKHADLIAFPARVADEASLPHLRRSAREYGITIVFGAEHREGEEVRNSAFVIGPDGTVLTRYDQLSAGGRYDPGEDARAMWFRVKGVPSVVTLGRDAMWTELAELAAVNGARIHIHLDDDHDLSANGHLRRVQMGANLASFLTFTAMANPVESMIWDDLGGMAECRAIVRNQPMPDYGAVEVFSPFSANLVARASSGGPQLIVATRIIPAGANPFHPRRTSNFNPQMESWYRIGADLVRPK